MQVRKLPRICVPQHQRRHHAGLNCFLLNHRRSATRDGRGCSGRADISSVFRCALQHLLCLDSGFGEMHSSCRSPERLHYRFLAFCSRVYEEGGLKAGTYVESQARQGPNNVVCMICDLNETSHTARVSHLWSRFRKTPRRGGSTFQRAVWA